MANVHDVAAYVVGSFEAPISTMKLQKLTYFGQGWSLGLLDRPMFSEDFEAWRRGPVCDPLYQRHRGEFNVGAWDGDADAIGEREKYVLEAMLANYGALSGLELGELTHRQGTPWSEVRRQSGLAEAASSKVQIPKDLMKSYFAKALQVAS